MVLGELGRFPIEVKVKLRMISFWSRLIQSESKLSSILYKLMLSLYEQNQQIFKWIKCVESIFNEVGLGYIFQNQVGYFDKNMVKQILRDQFIQKLSLSVTLIWYSVSSTNKTDRHDISKILF